MGTQQAKDSTDSFSLHLANPVNTKNIYELH